MVPIEMTTKQERTSSTRSEPQADWQTLLCAHRNVCEPR